MFYVLKAYAALPLFSFTSKPRILNAQASNSLSSAVNISTG